MVGYTASVALPSSEGVQEGVKFTVITEWPEFTVHPEVGGQAESTGCVVFYIVAPTCISYMLHEEHMHLYGIFTYKN